MNLIERAKNIILTPKPEWDKINNEKANVPAIITGYILPLAVIAAAAAFIGYALIGHSVAGGLIRIKSTEMGLFFAVRVLIGSIASVFLSAFIIDILAPNFASEKNMDKSIQLVAYSYTPSLIGGIFMIFPSLGFLGLIAGLYGLYLLYIGIPPMKKTPEDKHGTYFVVSLLVMIVVYAVVYFLVERILGTFWGSSYDIFRGSRIRI